MALLRIAEIGHPILRQVAHPLTADELREPRWQRFIDDLVETMHDADGAGLAAIQVYEPVRICAIEIKPNNPRYPEKKPIPLTILVNPVITPLSDRTFASYEGCLSVPNLRGIVNRHADIRVDFLDREGAPHSRTVSGIEAVTYQHECDHLDGKLFLDRVTDTTTLTTWTNFARHHRVAPA